MAESRVYKSVYKVYISTAACLFVCLWSAVTFHVQMGENTGMYLLVFVFPLGSLPFKPLFLCLPHPSASFVWPRGKLNRAEPDLSCLTHTQWCTHQQTLPVWSCTSSNLHTVATKPFRVVCTCLSLLPLCLFTLKKKRSSGSRSFTINLVIFLFVLLPPHFKQK